MLKNPRNLSIFLSIFTCTVACAQEEPSFCEWFKERFCSSAFYPLAGPSADEEKQIDTALDKASDYGDFSKRFATWIATHSHSMTASSSIKALADLPTQNRVLYQHFIAEIFQKTNDFLERRTTSSPFVLLPFDRVVSHTAYLPASAYYNFVAFYSSVLQGIKVNETKSTQRTTGSSGLTKEDQLSWLIKSLTEIPVDNYSHVLRLSECVLPVEIDVFARGKILSALGHANSADLELGSYVKPYINPNAPDLSALVVKLFIRFSTNQRQELAFYVNQLSLLPHYRTKRYEAMKLYKLTEEEEEKIFISWTALSLGTQPTCLRGVMLHFRDNVVLYGAMYKEATT